MLDAIPPVIDVVTKGTDWATIVTGVVGVAGIIGTYWQGKRAREATSQDLRDSLQADTDRALRADRRGVYARFLAIISKATEAIFVFGDEWTAAEGDHAKRLILRSTYGETLTELYTASDEVALIAPEAIGTAVHAVIHLFTDAFNAVVNDETIDTNSFQDDVEEKTGPLFKAMRADLHRSAEKSSQSRKGKARLRDGTSPSSF
jgi:hypothetical protein